MAAGAFRDRPVSGQASGRIAMTSETEIVKARLGAHPNGGAVAAVTTDARLLTAPIDVVVMTLNAVHCTVFVVREVQGQPLTAAQERLAQSQGGAIGQQCKQHNDRAEDHGQHKPRVPPEHEPADETPALLSRLTLGAPTQQGEQHDARQQNVGDDMRAAMDIASGGQDVHREKNDQQAGRDDMCRLEIAVARPQPRAECSTRRHAEKEQRDQSQDPGILVAWGCQLEMLHHGVIGAER